MTSFSSLISLSLLFFFFLPAGPAPIIVFFSLTVGSHLSSCFNPYQFRAID
jgi:hypothetical protein